MLIDTFAQAVAQIEFLFLLVQVSFVSAEAAGLSDPASFFFKLKAHCTSLIKLHCFNCEVQRALNLRFFPFTWFNPSGVLRPLLDVFLRFL